MSGMPNPRMHSPPPSVVEGVPIGSSFPSVLCAELDSLKARLLSALGCPLDGEAEVAQRNCGECACLVVNSEDCEGRRVSLDAPDSAAPVNSTISNLIAVDKVASDVSEDAVSLHVCAVQATTPLLQLTVREEWTLDDSWVKRSVGDTEIVSPSEVFSYVSAEGVRVIHELRSFAKWAPQLSQPSSINGGEEHGRLPLNPHSRARLVWDIVGLSLVLYDAVMTPLLLTVLEHGISASGIIVPLIINIFWTFDIVLSFITATDTNGELDYEWANIVRRYAKSWLGLDIVMVAPEWFWTLAEGSSNGYGSLRILKVVRAIRLMRLVKMQSILREQLKRLNSEVLINMVNLSLFISAFLMLNHYIACAWFLIGRTTGDGWFAESSLNQSSLEGYILALHWSITQFHGSMEVAPGNTSERIFAVVVLIVGMLTFSIFVSVITDMMFQVRRVQKRYNDQKMKLHGYFTRHSVSTALMLSVKAHLQLRACMDCQDDTELLATLPPQVRRSLLLEVRQPTLEGHWLLKWMGVKYRTAFSDVCNSALVPMSVFCGHSVFPCMDACNQMYFVEIGTLVYLSKEDAFAWLAEQRRSFGPDSRFMREVSHFKIGKKVSGKQWVCELALWIQGWQTRGELVSVANSVLLCLESSRFAKVITSYPSLRLDVTVYAHWVVQQLKDSDWEKAVDLWMPPRSGVTSR